MRRQRYRLSPVQSDEDQGEKKDFKEEFEALCRENNVPFIPAVIPRVHAPPVQAEKHSVIIPKEQVKPATRPKKVPKTFQARSGSPRSSVLGASTQNQPRNGSITTPVPPPSPPPSNASHRRFHTSASENLKRTGSVHAHDSSKDSLHRLRKASLQVRGGLDTTMADVVDDVVKRISTTPKNTSRDMFSSVGSSEMAALVDNQTERSMYTTFNVAPISAEFSYFKPCIQVEEDTRGDDESPPDTKEIYIRGWKVDGAMMHVLTECMATQRHLATLQLWNVSLDDGALAVLSQGVENCGALKTLILDGNRLGGCQVSNLLFVDSCVTHLSLRYCELTDTEVHALAACLKSPSCPLLILNLSTNRVTDTGASYLADMLKVNRELVALNLASNQVTDEGARSLAMALAYFPLTHEQVVQRRQLQSMKLAVAELKENVIPRPKRSHCKPISLQAARSRTCSVEKKDRARGQGGGQPQSKIPSQYLGSAHHSKNVHRNKKEKDKGLDEQQRRKKEKKSKDIKTLLIEREPEDSSEYILSGKVTSWMGELWVKGNRKLLSLNLARNQIGIKGIQELLNAVQEQSRGYIVGEHKSHGLRRLPLHGNPVPDTNYAYTSLASIMRCRDPSHRVPRLNLAKSYVSPCAMPLPF